MGPCARDAFPQLSRLRSPLDERLRRHAIDVKEPGCSDNGGVGPPLDVVAFYEYVTVNGDTNKWDCGFHNKVKPHFVLNYSGASRLE